MIPFWRHRSPNYSRPTKILMPDCRLLRVELLSERELTLQRLMRICLTSSASQGLVPISTPQGQTCELDRLCNSLGRSGPSSVKRLGRKALGPLVNKSTVFCVSTCSVLGVSLLNPNLRAFHVGGTANFAVTNCRFAAAAEKVVLLLVWQQECQGLAGFSLGTAMVLAMVLAMTMAPWFS